MRRITSRLLRVALGRLIESFANAGKYREMRMINQVHPTLSRPQHQLVSSLVSKLCALILVVFLQKMIQKFSGQWAAHISKARCCDFITTTGQTDIENPNFRSRVHWSFSEYDPGSQTCRYLVARSNCVFTHCALCPTLRVPYGAIPRDYGAPYHQTCGGPYMNNTL